MRHRRVRQDRYGAATRRDCGDDRVMLRAMAIHPGSCASCGGKGWKLMSLRRSLLAAGGVGEWGQLKRRRVTCLACGGAGSAEAAGDASVTNGAEVRS